MSSDTPLERVNYFEGQMLTAADFQAEQEYHQAKRRRHNRYLHGWGVVCGLGVSARGVDEIWVEPGLAIDCCGNEILLPDPERLTIPDGPAVLYLAIGYKEIEWTPVPALAEATETESTTTAYARIVEGFSLDIVRDDPARGHRRKGPGTPGCGLPHPLCIARLRKTRRGWKVEPCSHRRSTRGAWRRKC
jgi:hypothetical protein